MCAPGFIVATIQSNVYGGAVAAGTLFALAHAAAMGGGMAAASGGIAIAGVSCVAVGKAVHAASVATRRPSA